MARIKLIVAMGENGVIGNKGEIPWRLPDEMKHFKETTMGHTVVMGFKTWESLLPFNKRGFLDGRTNIVLTNNQDKAEQMNLKYKPEEYPIGTPIPWLLFSSKFDILEQQKINSKKFDHIKPDHIFIIGGAQIYSKYLIEDVVEEMIITRVKMKFNGDAKFPDVNQNNWTLLSVENRQYFDILHYQRAR